MEVRWRVREAKWKVMEAKWKVRNLKLPSDATIKRSTK